MKKTGPGDPSLTNGTEIKIIGSPPIRKKLRLQIVQRVDLAYLI